MWSPAPMFGLVNWRTFAAKRPFGLLYLVMLGWAGPGLAQGKDASLASLDVTVTGITSATGVIRLAQCPSDAKFPDCGKQAVRTEALRIDGGQARITLTGLAPGSYAISVFHDANSNGRLDTFAGVPREGYGFSNNPGFQPRAPRFSECEIMLSGADAANIRLRYLF